MSRSDIAETMSLGHYQQTLGNEHGWTVCTCRTELEQELLELLLNFRICGDKCAFLFGMSFHRDSNAILISDS